MAKRKVDTTLILWNSPGGSAWNERLLQGQRRQHLPHVFRYARGTEITMNTYNYLTLFPSRDEDGLRFTMSWLRHHDRYDTGHLQTQTFRTGLRTPSLRAEARLLGNVAPRTQ